MGLLPFLRDSVNTVVTDETIWIEFDVDFFRTVFALFVLWSVIFAWELDAIRQRLNPELISKRSPQQQALEFDSSLLEDSTDPKDQLLLKKGVDESNLSDDGDVSDESSDAVPHDASALTLIKGDFPLVD